jgi:hypothetical protein
MMSSHWFDLGIRFPNHVLYAKYRARPLYPVMGLQEIEGVKISKHAPKLTQ